jgi:hypothetical protein
MSESAAPPLAMEIEDMALAIDRGDLLGARRLISAHPALADAVDRNGVPLRERARAGADREIERLFDR